MDSRGFLEFVKEKMREIKPNVQEDMIDDYRRERS